MDGEGGGRNEPAVEPRPGYGPLAIEQACPWRFSLYGNPRGAHPMRSLAVAGHYASCERKLPDGRANIMGTSD
jgi:hypothetical protein